MVLRHLKTKNMKVKNLQFSVMLALLMLVFLPGYAQFSGGDGTEENPYQIATLDDLKELSLAPAEWDAYFVLTADIDAAATSTWKDEGETKVKGFSPIGTGINENFGGTFDGQGHTISNLYINRPTAQFVGLFGRVGDSGQTGTIKDLNVSNATVVGYQYVGGAFGYINYGYVTNVHSDAQVEALISAISYAGAFAGRASGYFYNCSASGSVKGSGMLGGFAGYLNNATYAVDAFRCYATASVTASNTADEKVGGFVGETNATVSDCYATGAVSGMKNTGGFAGKINSGTREITNCFALGTVHDSIEVAGAFAGYIVGGVVTNCYAAGQVILAPGADADKVGGFYGASGSTYAEYTDCYFNTVTTGQADVGYTGITGLDATAFTTEGSYENWDFVSDWELTIMPSIDGETRPYLQAFLYDYLVDYEITIADAGSVTGVRDWYNAGDVATYTAAAPNDPYLFAGWYAGDDLLTTDLTVNYTVNSDILLTAKYYAAYGGGSGTEEDPYLLSTLEDLQILQNNTADYDKYFALANDIDLSETNTWTDEEGGEVTGFKPIGYEGVTFQGSLNGRGFTIQNMFINRPQDDYQGFFGWVSYATIDSLNFENAQVSGKDYTGSLVGKALWSEITACSSTNATVSGSGGVGGLMGFLNGSVYFSHTSGAVTGLTSYAGGLYGQGSLYGTVSQCYSTATVVGNLYVGGLTGAMGNNASYCYATGDVTGRYCVGGFNGFGSGSSEYCFATGSVTEDNGAASADDYGSIGGFVGDFGVGKHSACYATGAVYGSLSAATGGFGGSASQSTAYYSIENCVFDTETTGQTSKGWEGVTALTTSQFADTANYPDWDFEGVWELAVLSEIDAETRPYQKPFLGYDFIVYYEVENAYAGEASADIASGVWVKIGDEITLDVTVKEGYAFEGWYLNDVKVASTPQATLSITEEGTYVAKHTMLALPFAGSGTSTAPYQLTSYNDLVWLSNLSPYIADKSFVLAADIDASASTTDNDGLGFQPIDNFTGTINGVFGADTFNISNLYINRPDEDQVGLFSVVYGKVSNLVLVDPDITGGNEVGALFGIATNYCSFSNCGIEGGSVTATSKVGSLGGRIYSGYMKLSSVYSSYAVNTVVTGNDAVGGLFGASKADVIGCYAEVVVNGDYFVGGLVGIIQSDANGYVFPVVKNSYANSTVNAKAYVGGFAGYLDSEAVVKTSYSWSTVNADGAGDEDGFYAGGFAGYIYSGTILDSYALGTVNALNRSGGFVGYVYGNCSILRSYTAAELYAEGTFNGAFTSIINDADVTIRNCFYDKTIAKQSVSVVADETNGVAKMTGLTTDELKVQSNLTGFDFAGTWEMRRYEEVDTLTRPYLKWRNGSHEVSVTLSREDVAEISGTGWYNVGDEVTLSATLNPGWIVSAWTLNEDTLSTAASYTFTIVDTMRYTIEVYFEEHFSGAGSGTEADPFQISTLDELEEVTYLNTFWDRHFILMNDIDASATADWHVGDHDKSVTTSEVPMGFYPIGDFATSGLREQIPFTGSFDGQGYTISNIYINRPADRQVGFFGTISGARIENLTLDNATITGGNYSGGLVARSSSNGDLKEDLKNYITNCHISNSQITGVEQAGALIGSIYYSEITNCTAYDNYTLGYLNIGGLAGHILSSNVVDNCQASGRVYASGTSAGGLVGWSNSKNTITNSSASTRVTGSNNVGGLVGYFGAYGTISNCSSHGYVKSTNYYGRVGGFIGWISYGNIQNCYSTGTTEAYDAFAGGFVGYATAGRYTVIDQCYASGDVIARSYSGGFIGAAAGKITMSYSTGNVICSTDVDGDAVFGGFIGFAYPDADVSNCFTVSNVSGYEGCGGFAGGIYGASIKKCYAAGNISSTQDDKGGFIGYGYTSTEGFIIDSYFDKDKAGTADDYAAGVETYGNAVGLASESFAVADSMPGLSFYGIWQIALRDSIDADFERPYFKWEDGGALLTVTPSVDYAGEILGDGWYNDGEEVVLSFDAHPGFVFTAYSKEGSVVSTANPYTFTFAGAEAMELVVEVDEQNMIASGSGTEADPYVISTLDELVCLSNMTSLWDKHFVLGNDIDAYDTRFLRDKSGFNPIGYDEDIRFTGSFNGQGYTISDLYINRSMDDDAQAMFAYVGQEVGSVTSIKNLNLVDAGVAGQNGVASLVADMQNTEVINCHAEGFVLGAYSYVGGLVARSRDTSLVENCSFRGAVYAPSATLYETSIGGLVGYNGNSMVRHSYAITDSVAAYGEAVGALVGYNHDVNHGDGTDSEAEFGIEQCYAATGYVSTAGEFLGGLVGANNGAFIKESYVVAPLVSLNSMISTIGGLTGYNIEGEIYNSYYNLSEVGTSYNSYGTGLSTTQMENNSLYKDWDFTNDWKMAYGVDAALRPYFAELPSYTLEVYADDNGSFLVQGKQTAIAEFRAQVMAGDTSPTFTALPNVGYEFLQWEVVGGGIWDTESEVTSVPDIAVDWALRAVFASTTAVAEGAVDAISIYPNPVENELRVTGFEGTARIQISNMAGQVVHQQNVSVLETINISHLKNGVYVLSLETDQVLKQIKVVKK